jgi:hypothetical protein
MAIITHRQVDPDFLVRYTLQVSGDHVGILIHGHDGESELLVVEWKTGLIEMVRKIPQDDV